MRIATIAAASTNLVNKEIEAGIHKLRFYITGLSDSQLLDGILDDLIGLTKITLQKQGGGNDTMLQSLSLIDVAEISTHNEGILRITQTGAGPYSTTLEFTVEIANNSAFQADDNRKIILNIEGKPADMVYTIDAIDHPNTSNSYIKYDNKFVNANVSKDFPVSEHYAMALPVASITAVELYYDNARVVKLTADEYKQMLTDSQDVIASINGATTFGYGDWGVMSIEHCWKVTVTLTDSTNIYFLKQTA